MSKIECQISNGELLIFELSDIDPNHPDFYDDTPVHLSIEEAIQIIEMEGIGKNLSKLVVELTGYSWVDRQYLDAVIKFIRENYPEADISWKETFEYLDGMK